MLGANSPVEDLIGYQVVIPRFFKAPRELVFKAWTDPKHLKAWWGPGGFTNPRCEWDPRPGGAIRIDMRGPNGVIYPMGGVCKEVVPPEKLVFTSGPIDEKGNFLFEVLNTVTFADAKGGTEIRLESTGPPRERGNGAVFGRNENGLDAELGKARRVRGGRWLGSWREVGAISA